MRYFLVDFGNFVIITTDFDWLEVLKVLLRVPANGSGWFPDVYGWLLMGNTSVLAHPPNHNPRACHMEDMPPDVF